MLIPAIVHKGMLHQDSLTTPATYAPYIPTRIIAKLYTFKGLRMPTALSSRFGGISASPFNGGKGDVRWSVVCSHLFCCFPDWFIVLSSYGTWRERRLPLALDSSAIRRSRGSAVRLQFLSPCEIPLHLVRLVNFLQGHSHAPHSYVLLSVCGIGPLW